MNSKKLTKILNMVMPAVEKSTVISQYDHFVFYDGHVSTYNGKIFFSHPIDTDINCSVIATDLLNVMQTIDESDDVELELVNGNLSVKSSDVDASLATEVHEDSVVRAITSMNLDGLDWETAYTVPNNFIDGIKDCLFSVSKDANDIRNLHNVHVIGNIVETGDGYRCSEFILSDDMPELLLPSSSAMVLANFNPDLCSLSQGWVHFIDDSDVIFSIRLGSGDFPDIGKIVEAALKKFYEVKLPKGLQEFLKMFSNMSSGDMDIYKFVEITIKDGVLSLSTERDVLNIQKTMIYDEDDNVDVKFFISPVFLNSIMDKTNIVKVNTDMNCAIFTISDFTHVITLPEK